MSVLFSTLLASALLLLSGVTPASADGMRDGPPTVFDMYNPCAPEDGVITFTGYMHTAVLPQRDGVTVYHTNSHFTGVSQTGTRYELTSSAS